MAEKPPRRAKTSTLDKVFIDTNILIYAHDVDAEDKHRRAVEVIKGLWETRSGILSAQVLQEFYVNATKKMPKPLSRAEAREIVQTYACWRIEKSGPSSIVRASEIEERHKLSFGDALIIVAAIDGGAVKLLSEDLNPGQNIEGILIENPLAG